MQKTMTAAISMVPQGFPLAALSNRGLDAFSGGFLDLSAWVYEHTFDARHLRPDPPLPADRSGRRAIIKRVAPGTERVAAVGAPSHDVLASDEAPRGAGPRARRRPADRRG